MKLSFQLSNRMGYKLFGIEFAPWSIPLERRLQTLAVVYYVSQIILVGLLSGVVLVYLLFTPYYYVSLLYLAWFVYDRRTGETGGRRSRWFRNLKIWRYFANFFPVKLIKTVDLPADRNYIFASHPHGVLCFSHFVNYATEGTNFSRIFPGIVPHVITVNYQFLAPMQREQCLFAGACSASSRSIEHILSMKGTGNAVCLIVGGAREMILTTPDAHLLVLKRRQGFVRLALKNGASLVPVISFGENDVYKTYLNRNKTFLAIQDKLMKVCGIGLPIVVGRGIFQYSFGFLPHRKPITTVVGKPIHVTKNPNPSQEEINKLHSLYMAQLAQLFEQYNPQYGHEGMTLEMI